MSLFSELKRRNVFKVGLAYLALGWAVIQAGSTLVPVLHLPEWTLSMVLWLGLAGLPFVLVFAWIYELTPDGLRRTGEVDAAQSIGALTSRRLDVVIIAMLGVAMLLFALDRFIPRPPDASPPVEAGHARDTNPDATADTDGRAHGALLQGATLTPEEKSIAVLPFVDMSPGKDQEYFSDGISEELLNLLAKIPELKVIARTSSFSFKGKDVAIAEIARQLNVAHVLEG
ncbi:MAG: adenylyl cyclase, partial [Gammaproteobacteria bacterium]